MGRSAKTHKRAPKKGGAGTNGTRPAGESSAILMTPAATAPTPATKRRQSLKQKVARRANKDDADLLGGADYVTLLLGGRRKASEEAKKLAEAESSVSLGSLAL